jgi:hypothetical protein
LTAVHEARKDFCGIPDRQPSSGNGRIDVNSGVATPRAHLLPMSSRDGKQHRIAFEQAVADKREHAIGH